MASTPPPNTSPTRRAQSVTFWGLALPSLLVTGVIKLWYLHMVNVASFGAWVFLESTRKTMFVLLAASFAMMASATLVRGTRSLVAHLATWQIVAIGLALVEGSGALFASETGATLDLYVLRAGMATDIVNILNVSVPSQFQLLVLSDIAVILVAPWYLVWRGAPQRHPTRSAKVWLIAALLSVAIAALPSAAGGDARVAIAQSPTLKMVGQVPWFVSSFFGEDTAVGRTAGSATVARTRGASQRNVVVVLLESMRQDALGTYPPHRATTPRMDEIANDAWVFERAYIPLPATSKALVATLCGVYPDPTVQLTEAVAGRIPERCLPELLGDVGYRTRFMHPARADDQLFRPIVANLGFDDSLHLEDFDIDGFRRVNYVGYEETTMLAPSERWISARKAAGEPFLLTYLTTSSHHDYAIPSEEIGEYAADELFNRYLSGVNMTDRFVGDIVDMLKRLEVWDDTVLVLVGDHGEAFGEHGAFHHNGALYEEILRVPLIVRVPGAQPRRNDDLVNQLDLLPTLVAATGHVVTGGEYVGSDLARPVPPRRLYASCLYDLQCMSVIDWPHKYIYNFGIRPEELYDLARDPAETDNLAPDNFDAATRYAHDIRAWYRATRALHGERPSR